MKKISRIFFGLFLILSLCVTGFACKEPAKYTVTFMDGASQYAQVSVEENSTASKPVNDPTKAEDAQYTYTFDGWYNGETKWDFSSPVTSDLTLTAGYTSTVRQYSVTFKNEDGSIYETINLDYGAQIVLPSTNPTKSATAQYTYTFAGWSGYTAGMTVDGNEEFVATFADNVNTYTVTFKNEDGSIYETINLDYGAQIVLPSTNPTKSATAQYTYTFDGWTGYTDGATVTGNAEFTARFNSTVNKYTVTFYKEDGTILEESLVDYGAKAQSATAPNKDKHAFSYWATISGAYYDFNNTTITGDIALYPVYIKTVEEYTVTFMVDGEVYATVLVESGSTIGTLAPADPTKESTETIAYTFDSWRQGSRKWNLATGTVTRDITLTARFTETPIIKPVVYYNVNFVASGVTVQTYQFEENTTAVEFPGPEKVVDDNYNYTFAGWYQVYEDGTVADNEWDFSTLLTSDVTLRAMYNRKIKPTYFETFDQETYGEDIPDYIWEREAAYGLEPDLEGYIIDGKKGEAENWDNQNYYTTTITTSPRISYTVTTQFSDLGLYVFAQASDDAGIMHDGINYMFMNTCFTFYMTDGARTTYDTAWVKSIKVDSRNVYPTQTRVKLAIRVEEGRVNSNAPAIWNVEYFIAWEDIGITEKPETVKMYVDYQYKNVAGSTTVYHLKAPFAGSISDMPSYIIYDENGYTSADAEGAVIGESVYGVAKTTGWDVSNATDEENAHVYTNANGTNIAFFRTEDGSAYGDYYSFEATIEPMVTEWTSNINAGLAIYKNDTIYSFMYFAINSTTYDFNTGFKSAFAKVRRGNLDKTVTNFTVPTQLDIPNSEEVKGVLHVRILFANSYVYYLVNDKLIYCEYVDALNIDTMPAIISYNAKVKFSNYAFKKYTETEMAAETKKYAFVVDASAIAFKTSNNDEVAGEYVPEFAYNEDGSIVINNNNQFVDQYGKRFDTETRDLTIGFDAIGVSSDASDNAINMTLNHASFNPDDNAIRSIKNAALNGTAIQGVGKFVTKVNRVFKSVKVNTYEDPDTHLTINDYKGYDITDDFLANNVEGVYTLRNITADTSVRYEMTTSTDEELVALYSNLVNKNDISENANLDAVATIYSNNPRYGIMTAPLVDGELIVALEKGYIYRLMLSAKGYRKVYIDVNNGEPLMESMCIGEAKEIVVEDSSGTSTVTKWCILATSNVMGGTCYSSNLESSFTKVSSSANWDYSGDTDGYSIFTHDKATSAGGQIYFTGRLGGYVQYAECVFTNTTDVNATSEKTEPDPTVGFCISGDKNSATIALRYDGVRYLDGVNGWSNVKHWTGYKNQTVGVFPKHNDNGTITYTKTKLAMLRMYNKVYVYISDPGETSTDPFCEIDLLDWANGEAAIGIIVSTSYVTQILAEDYYCVEGDEAYDKAIELLAVDVNLGQGCTDARYGKEFIQVGGKSVIDYKDDSREDAEIVWWGNEITVEIVEENTQANYVYIVTAGNNTVTVSQNNPTGQLLIDKSFDPAVGLTCERKAKSTINGETKVVDENGNPIMVEKVDEEGNVELDQDGNPIMVEKVAANVSGKLIDKSSGAVIHFTTDAEGKYSIEGAVMRTYQYDLVFDGFHVEAYDVTTGTKAGSTVTAKLVTMHRATFGSAISQGSTILTSSAGGVKLGYNNKQYGIEGAYFEVDRTSGVALYSHTGFVNDFDLKFSYYRVYDSSNKTNAEIDPGVGIVLRSGKGNADTILFLQDGYRVLPSGVAWADILQAGKKWNGNVAKSGYMMDLRFIRRGETVHMFAKLHTEETYTYVFSFASAAAIGEGALAIVTSQTANKLNHYFISDIELTHLESTSRVEELEVDINVTVDGEGSYTMDAGNGYEGAYVLADTNRLVLSPSNGHQVAYVKINGVFAEVVKNVVYFTNEFETNIEIVFEEIPQSVRVKGKIEYDEKLPSNVTVIGYYVADGRLFEFPVRLNNSGEFTIDSIRLGVFKFTILLGNVAVKYTQEIEIVEQAEGAGIQDIGVFTPNVYVPHAVTVNGKDLSVNANLTSDADSVANDDIRWNKSVSGGANYLKVIEGVGNEFYLETNVTMDFRSTAKLGNSSSKYACDDEVNGFTIDTGTVSFCVMFWGNGLRISGVGGYSEGGGMIRATGNPGFPADTKEYTRKLAILKEYVEKAGEYVYKIYVDGVLYFELSEKTGISFKNGGNADNNYSYSVAKENVKSWIASLNESAELAIGFRCNTRGGNTGQFCAAGYSETKIVTNADVIAQYKDMLE